MHTQMPRLAIGDIERRPIIVAIVVHFVLHDDLLQAVEHRVVIDGELLLVRQTLVKKEVHPTVLGFIDLVAKATESVHPSAFGQ